MLTGLACLPRATSAATTTRFVQAEGAALNGACTLDTNHAGFTGTSFVNCPDDTISSIEWTGVRVQSAGTKRLKFRFANGSATNRASELVVNGVVESSNLAFAPTGAFTTWSFATIDVALDARDNSVRLRGAVAGQGLANIDRMDVSEISEAAPDWGIAVVESTMLRSPTPSSLGGWSYANAFRLLGMHRTYQRVLDPRYLRYIEAWLDSLVGSQGNLYTSSSHSNIRALDALDHIMPGRLILDVYDDLPKTNYRTALQTLRNRFSEASNTSGAQPTWSSAYPRTSDDGYYHAESKPGELWLDGAFMGQTFLHRYGQKFGGADETYADDEGTQQIIIQFDHLKDDVSGLLWHAYDEERNASWPFAPGTNHSQEFWCRAMGWYGMAIVEILDVLDLGHASRPQLISILQGIVAAFADFQDPATGRWFQLVDKGSNPANWTETSCSAMYSYTISRAVQGGFVDASYATVAAAGLDGVLAKVSFGANATLAADLTNVTDICEGTSIGNEAYYFARQRPMNDPRGLGAFLVMYEHFAAGSSSPAPSPPSNLLAADGAGRSVLSWDDNSPDEAGFEIERKPQGAPDTSFAQIAQVGADAVTYTDVITAGSYTYRVRAFAGVFRSTYSNSDDATVTAPIWRCGMGPELALAIALLRWARRRHSPRSALPSRRTTTRLPRSLVRRSASMTRSAASAGTSTSEN